MGMVLETIDNSFCGTRQIESYTNWTWNELSDIKTVTGIEYILLLTMEEKSMRCIHIQEVSEKKNRDLVAQSYRNGKNDLLLSQNKLVIYFMLLYIYFVNITKAIDQVCPYDVNKIIWNKGVNAHSIKSLKDKTKCMISAKEPVRCK